MTTFLDLHLHFSTATANKAFLFCKLLKVIARFTSCLLYTFQVFKCLRNDRQLPRVNLFGSDAAFALKCASSYSHPSRLTLRVDLATSTRSRILAPTIKRRALVVRDDNAEIALRKQFLLQPLLAAFSPSTKLFARVQRRQRRRYKTFETVVRVRLRKAHSCFARKAARTLLNFRHHTKSDLVHLMNSSLV